VEVRIQGYSFNIREVLILNFPKRRTLMLTYLKKNKNAFLIIGVALVAFLLGLFSQSLFSETGGNLGGAAGAMSEQAACDTSVLSSSDPTGIVLADPLLNMRAGPGLNYRVLTMLEICTPVSLKGRSSNNAWLEIRLSEDVGGWVFAGYIQANVNISNLKVTQASGGPTTNTSSGSSGGQGYISTVIQGNQATAYVTGMPANTQATATLSPSTGSGKSLAVASGQTNSGGNITLTFAMPSKWADGSAVKSGSMTLTVAGGGSTMTAWITYYK
jgi:uncharacterized protein YraI